MNFTAKTDLLFDGSLNTANELFDLGAELSTPNQNNHMELSISQSQIDRLEDEIDQLNINLDPLKSFVLPGGTAASSFLHLARTTIRRAERLMVKLSIEEKSSVTKESPCSVTMKSLCAVTKESLCSVTKESLRSVTKGSLSSVTEE